MQATTGPRSTGTATPNPIENSTPSNSSNLGDAERGLLLPHSVPISVRSVISAMQTGEDETEMQPTSSGSSTTNYIRHKTSQIFEAVMPSGKKKKPDASAPPALASLVDSYANSTIAAEIKEECETLRREATYAANGIRPPNGGGAVSNELPDVALETSMLRGRKRASYGTQFRILSGRAFKNLYRDPALLTAHYTSAIGLAIICGLFYHNVT
jgi:hypothetical protein